MIDLDNRLLKNFYLNNGFYNAEVNSSFARLIKDDEFELIFNINPGQKFFFNNLSLKLPNDFNPNNYEKISKLFSKSKGKVYSISLIEEILENIDNISINSQFQSTKASVLENIEGQNINLEFLIEETEKIFVEKINIYGNSITRENVIRNQFELDEGDPFNDILITKTTNNLRSLNYFKNVKSEILDGSSPDSKIINYKIEEKPTGEISAGAGFGTSGAQLLWSN